MATAVALYAAQTIPANGEILFNYGEGYDSLRKELNYKAGAAAKRPNASILQSPWDAGIPFLPLECFVAIEKIPPSRVGTATKSDSKNVYKRPRGRPPLGKSFDPTSGTYV